ncbi:MAG: XRE family transcriptional regulator [Gammaproteobacteria bacterium]|jgi:Zn-dependent peptidase ImmA (M78 family)/transcriptional regulator with XRE-family HTH domain|nr:XRE family transcriptional regulator [Gammaproteobacteria bacterium]
MDASQIRRRIAALRERSGMKQADLAKALGFNDRQTVSAIETGDRKVSAEELVRLADIFVVDMSVFSDPYTIFDGASFSWRRNEVPDTAIEQFEEQAKSWMALYRHLSRLAGKPVNSLIPNLGLTEKSSYEEAASAGELIANQFDLGDVPAAGLERMLVEELNFLVLHVDALEGISGAACRLDALNFVLVNRAEPAARRAFNLAHELFHLATWEQMTPEHIESVRMEGSGRPRAEQLADNFASGLLMPGNVINDLLQRHRQPNDAGLADWITVMARELAVSGPAMKWRLANLGLITRTMAARITDQDLKTGSVAHVRSPRPFSQRFIERLHWGLDGGHLTVRRAAKLMGMSIDDMADLFPAYGIPVPYDL